jgi:hypothetical protein
MQLMCSYTHRKFDKINNSVDLEWQNAAIKVTPVQKWSDAVGDNTAAATVQNATSRLSLFSFASSIFRSQNNTWRHPSSPHLSNNLYVHPNTSDRFKIRTRHEEPSVWKVVLIRIQFNTLLEAGSNAYRYISKSPIGFNISDLVPSLAILKMYGELGNRFLTANGHIHSQKRDACLSYHLQALSYMWPINIAKHNALDMKEAKVCDLVHLNRITYTPRAIIRKVK